MEPRVVVSLLVVWSIFLLNSLDVYANDEGDALIAFKNNLNNDNIESLSSWDPTLVNPCTWFHVTCNIDNSVIAVDLGSAGLYGGLSPYLGNLTNLERLNLYNNAILDSIPKEFGKLKNLVDLDMSSNALYGEIPESLGLLPKLEIIRLSDNVLSGPIVSEFANLTHLRVLDLSSNNLNGTLPEWYVNQQNLTSIQLNDNLLSGQVPTSWDTIIQNIQLVNLTSNPYLTGKCTEQPC